MNHDQTKLLLKGNGIPVTMCTVSPAHVYQRNSFASHVPKAVTPRPGYNRRMLDHLLHPPGVFRLCSTLVLPAWLLLVAAPRWRWTHRLATGVLPLLFAVIYMAMLASAKTPPGAGFKDLASVMLLFTSPAAVTAGWIHYLCFDLFTGAWQVREALRLGISHWLVIPCLLLTFLLGPVGLLLFLLLRWGMRGRFGVLPLDRTEPGYDAPLR